MSAHSPHSPFEEQASWRTPPPEIEADVIARLPTQHANLAAYGHILRLDHPTFAYALVTNDVNVMPGDQLAFVNFVRDDYPQRIGLDPWVKPGESHLSQIGRGINCWSADASVIVQRRRWFQGDLRWPQTTYAYWEHRLRHALGPDFFKIVADEPNVLDTHKAFRQWRPTTKDWLRELCAQIVAHTAEVGIAGAGLDASLAIELKMGSASEIADARVERIHYLGVAAYVRQRAEARRARLRWPRRKKLKVPATGGSSEHASNTRISSRGRGRPIRKAAP
jgi:hypothetical protein